MSDSATARDLTLILIRHSQAEDSGVFAATGSTDCERPLTAQGVKRMERAARGLREIIDGVDRILTSPCARAEQTARILVRELDHGVAERTDELAPGADPAALTDWLAREVSGGVVLLVGHEPDLSQLVGWLCAGDRVSLVTMKKGAACAVHFDGPPEKGRGTILWLMTQGQLRKV